MSTPAPRRVTLAEQLAWGGQTGSDALRILQEAQAELRRSNERFELIALVTNDVFWEWDVPSGRVTANDKLAEVYGWHPGDGPEDIAWWQAHVHPDDRARVFGAWEEHFAERRTTLWSQEYRFPRKDGRLATVFDRAIVRYDASGAPSRVLGVMADITDMREMQFRLQISDRMASIGTMAAGVAHEINNPLAYAMSNVEFVLNQLRHDEPLTGEELEALREAKEGLDRVRKIVRDLKSFARPAEDGGSADLRQVLQSAITMASNEIRHRARLVCDLEDVPRVNGGAGRLGQVFLNLLVNAAQAMPEGSADTKEIRVRTHNGIEGVVVEISDDGHGIPASVLPRIFDPFFTTKSPGEGTGLGLYVCHGIVSKLHGRIEVESEVGKGTTFRVTLPQAADQDGTDPGIRIGRGLVPAKVGKVLVVDDERLVGVSLGRALVPHAVSATTSAREALALVQAGGRYDVILCDLMMPEMTGMELHEAIRAVAPEQARRMVFLTGGAFTPGAREFLATVPNLRIDKPFDRDTVRAAVATTIG